MERHGGDASWRSQIGHFIAASGLCRGGYSCLSGSDSVLFSVICGFSVCRTIHITVLHLCNLDDGR